MTSGKFKGKFSHIVEPQDTVIEDLLYTVSKGRSIKPGALHKVAKRNGITPKLTSYDSFINAGIVILRNRREISGIEIEDVLGLIYDTKTKFFGRMDWSIKGRTNPKTAIEWLDRPKADWKFYSHYPGKYKGTGKYKGVRRYDNDYEV